MLIYITGSATGDLELWTRMDDDELIHVSS